MENNIYNKIAVILMAAGKSTRFIQNSSTLKQFFPLGNKQLYEYSLDFFLNYNFATIIVVFPKEFINKYNSFVNNDTFVNFVAGGETRTDSVFNAISYLKNNNFDVTHCIIHDVARPFIDDSILHNLIKEIYKYPSLTCAIKAIDTIGYGDTFVEQYFERNLINLIQTPQAFLLDLLFDCYIRYFNDNNKKNFTDDTSLVYEYSKVKPKIIEGSKNLFKITRFEDIEYANFLLQKLKNSPTN